MTPDAQEAPAMTATTERRAAASAGLALCCGCPGSSGAVLQLSSPAPPLAPVGVRPPFRSAAATAAATTQAGMARASWAWAPAELTGGTSMPARRPWASKTGPPSMPGRQRRSAASRAGCVEGGAG